MEFLLDIEDIFVREFRAYQSLVAIFKQERHLISAGNTDPLPYLVEKKNCLLDELRVLEEELGDWLAEWGRVEKINANDLTFKEFIHSLNTSDSRRLVRLRDGIRTLLVEVRELTNGIIALSDTGKSRVEATQLMIEAIH